MQGALPPAPPAGRLRRWRLGRFGYHPHMDATGGQNGAERADAPGSAPGRPLRCPECGRSASADSRSKKTGFWADPVRWMPAVLLWVLVGFQLATPVVLPDRVRTTALHQTDVQYTGTFGVLAEGTTWDDIAQAAGGSSRHALKLAPLVQQLTSPTHLNSWVDSDPAALIVLDDCTILPYRDPMLRRLSIGCIDPWLQVTDTEPYTGFVSTWECVCFGWKSGGASASIRWVLIYTANFVLTLLLGGLAFCFVFHLWRPNRAGRTHPSARRTRFFFAAGAFIAIVAMPTPPSRQFDQADGFDWDLLGRRWGGTLLTELTLSQLRESAQGQEPEIAVARTIYDAGSKRMPAAVLPPGSEHVPSLASISLFPVTPCDETWIRFGWPQTFLWTVVREKQPATGATEAESAFRWGSTSRHSVYLTKNSGGWPGTSIHMGFHTAAFALSLTIGLAVWWLFRKLLHSGLFHGSRKRAARGLCVGCGYDLKRLRRRAVVSE